MGVGHVPAGPVPAKSAGAQLPRRQHRRTGTRRPDLTDRNAIGAFGEALAAAYLDCRGLTIDGRNVRIGRGEVDLVASDGADRIVVEVKTVTGDDSARSFTVVKAGQVHALRETLAARRADLVTVHLSKPGVHLSWYPGV
ncbi:MAG: YraN family protein [Acidimicrobiia bacterium]|nr:YraN family protein [Acidimicrobiia bacterium]